ncbi:hypothetical protein CGRA01v4_05922 [Colletotrichum graminicola]|uniref:Uncharacterized protein n=1 Tax=Colletotrichum graminicola (strain M1.001 / M2 / FGSC 10212) TaxID=645133 RepID=E3QNK0_COLGM|nr:uncharacterized protein GLRG_07757 [Colletotrichum graminicola M1.001]EFQ32487.1 hypothetical protein GLRG_07757 [Colletotrichum graminicola M1.001]WDK14641.1 hypothetical protein CGRA01v4_05922 [Colletotrichum graminicola]
MSQAVFTTVFASIFYVAKVAINDRSVANGLFKVVKKQLHGKPIPFTSSKAMDSMLTMLVRFFQPILTGKDPALTLFSVFMIGQMLALQVIVQLEGLRAGNRGKLISYTTYWGFVWQLCTIGITLPIYFLLYTYTSAIPHAVGPGAFAAAISVDPVQARAVLWSVTLGAALPTLLAALPPPHVIAPRTSDVFLAAWQVFPLWTGIAQLAFSRAIAFLRVVPRAWTPAAAWGRTSRELSRVYASVLPVVALISCGALGYAFWASGGAPEPTAAMLKRMFVPPSPVSRAKMASLEKGILGLLQWDMYCASLATWTWVAYMAYQRKGARGAVSDLGKLVMWSPVVGPCGAALAVVWERDVEALKDVGEKEVVEEKKTK